MNDSKLLLKLAEANAYPEGADLPEEAWTRDLALREIERRIGMSQEKTRTTTRRVRRPTAETATTVSASGIASWTGLRIGVAALAVVLTVGALFLLNSEEKGLIAGQPPGPLDAYVAALQANDSEAALAALSSDVLEGFTPWLVGSDTSGIEVTNCEIKNAATGFVTCDVDMGPGFFYTLIGGDRETTLWANLEGSTIRLIDIPNPDANAAGGRFRRWMSEVHPERYDELFDDASPTTEKTVWSEEAGQLQFEFLDEYLDYLASQG